VQLNAHASHVLVEFMRTEQAVCASEPGNNNRRYPCEVTEYHPLCWTTWSGKSAARGAAYDAGLIGLKVLERDGTSYGFRAEATL
jgi:hypothetical protein